MIPGSVLLTSNATLPVLDVVILYNTLKAGICLTLECWRVVVTGHYRSLNFLFIVLLGFFFVTNFSVDNSLTCIHMHRNYLLAASRSSPVGLSFQSVFVSSSIYITWELVNNSESHTPLAEILHQNHHFNKILKHYNRVYV